MALKAVKFKTGVSLGELDSRKHDVTGTFALNGPMSASFYIGDGSQLRNILVNPMPDDTKLFFGTDSDAFIEYDEDGNDTAILGGSDWQFLDARKLYFGTNKDAYIEYDEATNDTAVLGGTDWQILDDKKLFFGTNKDAHIEYNEDGDDFLVISGPSNGIVLSGSTIQIAGTLEGASPLRIAGEVQFTSAGESSAFNFGPNKEAKIYYESSGTGALIVSGSSTTGTLISGSSLIVKTINGIGVGVDSSQITHAITLPNNDDASGQIKANAFIATSSRRYKKEIKALHDPMDVLNKIEGVSFKWKDSDRLDYGFIAEDVGKVLPNIVSWEDNKKDAHGIDYQKIISFLVEAVKKQEKEINKLKQMLK